MFTNYWAHKGGKFGRCHSHPDADFFWVNIPKNASSWTQTFFAHEFLWFAHDYYDQPEIKSRTGLICLRDPLDRWISGITEYFVNYHPDIDLDQINDATLQLIADRVVFDDHTEKQTMYINGLDLSSCIFFRCDNSYRRNFLDFFTSINRLPENYEVPTCVDDFRNDHSENTRKTVVYNFWASLIADNADFRRAIELYYMDDYNLLKTTTFYRAKAV